MRHLAAAAASSSKMGSDWVHAQSTSEGRGGEREGRLAMYLMWRSDEEEQRGAPCCVQRPRNADPYLDLRLRLCVLVRCRWRESGDERQTAGQRLCMYHFESLVRVYPASFSTHWSACVPLPAAAQPCTTVSGTTHV